MKTILKPSYSAHSTNCIIHPAHFTNRLLFQFFFFFFLFFCCFFLLLLFFFCFFCFVFCFVFLFFVLFCFFVVVFFFFFFFFFSERSFDFYWGGREDFWRKKIQDPILPGKNIQDRGKRYSTFCIRGE